MPEANRNDIMEAAKDTTTQSNSNAKREQKRVQFFPRVKFRRLGLWKTEGEVRKSWYSSEELENARKSEKSLRDYFSLTNNLTPTSTENLLILGFRTEEERKRKIRVAKQSVLAVLKEQLKQETQFLEATEEDDDALFYLDFEEIKLCYAKTTKESEEEALERGIRTAKFVNDETSTPFQMPTIKLSSPRSLAPAPPKVQDKTAESPPRSPLQVPSKRSFTNAAA